VVSRFDSPQSDSNWQPPKPAAALWLEFQAGAEGQKILDEVDLSASIFSPGSAHERLTRGKPLSLVAWDHYLKMGRYEEEIVKAFGFPRAEKK
jgi:hypothetical protein